MQLKRTTSQTLKGSKFERKTKSLFKPKIGNRAHLRCRCIQVPNNFMEGNATEQKLHGAKTRRDGGKERKEGQGGNFPRLASFSIFAPSHNLP